MPALPEIIWNSASTTSGADATSAAPENSPSLPAAVALNHNSALAPAMAAESATAPDLTDHPVAVAELLEAHHAKHHRFRLDERAFAEAIEEPPLFLRAAGFCR